MTIGLDLYRDDVMYATVGYGTMFFHDHQSIDLRPLVGNVATRYRVQLYGPWQELDRGWPTGRVRLQIDNWWSDLAPMTFYVGDPTDWPSGLARFRVPSENWAAEAAEPYAPGHVWTVALRRFS